MTLSLVLAESSIELVPERMARHPAVAASARRSGKRPSEMLLDNSWHYSAMKGIEDEHKRGRPDLVHFSLLEATGIPLYLRDRIRIYVHTINDDVMVLGRRVRLPKSFHRFSGLVEQLYREGRIEADGAVLLELRRMDFASLIRHISPNRTVALSTAGARGTYAGVAPLLGPDACLVVGGFQRGQFSSAVSERIDESYSMGDPLEAHTVLARILYEYEKTIFM